MVHLFDGISGLGSDPSWSNSFRPYPARLWLCVRATKVGSGVFLGSMFGYAWIQKLGKKRNLFTDCTLKVESFSRFGRVSCVAVSQLNENGCSHYVYCITVLVHIDSDYHIISRQATSYQPHLLWWDWDVFVNQFWSEKARKLRGSVGDAFVHMIHDWSWLIMW